MNYSKKLQVEAIILFIETDYINRILLNYQKEMIIYLDGIVI